MTDTKYTMMIARCVNADDVYDDDEYETDPVYGPWKLLTDKKMTLQENILEVLNQESSVTEFDVVGAFLEGVHKYSFEGPYAVWEPAPEK